MSPIQVTKAFLPRLDEVMGFLQQAWAAGQLTNNGQLVQKLERELEKELGIERLLTASNGTVAIQMALEAVGATKNVVTTPFSYVATTSSILWQRCTPVFVDIDPETLCIDPTLTREAVDRDTSAILATHVFGIPCDLDQLDGISADARCTLIYDAAHAFGTKVNGTSILGRGDISTLSFHATKLFHTGEGGAMIARTPELFERLKLIRSFGHVGDEHFCLGLNGKMSELHAALGLAVLPQLESIRADRRRVSLRYTAKLAGARVRFPVIPKGVEYNHAYFPVLFSSEAAQVRVRSRLNEAAIFPRRYFFPSLNTLNYVGVRASCPVSEEAARTVLCLPLYVGLADADIDRIAAIVGEAA